MENTNKQRTLVITGFGPFEHHEVNASWEAVKLFLKISEDLKSRYNINIFGTEVPVAYEEVSEITPKLWEEHNPLVN